MATSTLTTSECSSAPVSPRVSMDCIHSSPPLASSQQVRSPQNETAPSNPAPTQQFRVEDLNDRKFVYNAWIGTEPTDRSEEHTSELKSLMSISYEVVCLKTKQKKE